MLRAGHLPTARGWPGQTLRPAEAATWSPTGSPRPTSADWAPGAARAALAHVPVCLTAGRQQAELLWLCKGASGLYPWRTLSQV